MFTDLERRARVSATELMPEDRRLRFSPESLAKNAISNSPGTGRRGGSEAVSRTRRRKAQRRSSLRPENAPLSPRVTDCITAMHLLYPGAIAADVWLMMREPTLSTTRSRTSALSVLDDKRTVLFAGRYYWPSENWNCRMPV